MSANQLTNKIFYTLFVLNIPLLGIISFILAINFDQLLGETMIYIVTLILTVGLSFVLFKVGKKSKLAFYLLSILTSAIAILIINFIFSPIYS